MLLNDAARSGCRGFAYPSGCNPQDGQARTMANRREWPNIGAELGLGAGGGADEPAATIAAARAPHRQTTPNAE
jgi:hypothetical protein